jgi:hypothetical protein
MGKKNSLEILKNFILEVSGPEPTGIILFEHATHTLLFMTIQFSSILFYMMAIISSLMNEFLAIS